MSGIRPAQQDVGSEDHGFLRRDGYQINGKSYEHRIDVLRKTSIPKHGANSVVYAIGSFMISRGLDAKQQIKYANALREWNRDINWILLNYGNTNAWVKKYIKKQLRPVLEKNGFNWVEGAD